MRSLDDREACLPRQSRQIVEAELRIGERMRLGGVLLGLADQPAAVVGVGQGLQRRLELDRPVGGADDSRKGLRKRTPVNVVERSAMVIS